MLGPQVGIRVLESHDLNYYKSLFEHLLEKLDITMQRYQVEIPDFIIINLKERRILLRLNFLKLNKGIVKVGVTRQIFNSNILPLTLNEKYFGSLLQDQIRLEYLEDLIRYLHKNISPTPSPSTSITLPSVARSIPRTPLG